MTINEAAASAIRRDENAMQTDQLIREIEMTAGRLKSIGMGDDFEVCRRAAIEMRAALEKENAAMSLGGVITEVGAENIPTKAGFAHWYGVMVRANHPPLKPGDRIALIVIEEPSNGSA